MFCISINYKKADLNFRKNFAFQPDIQREILSVLTDNNNISQCVLLCTCNRTELYFCGDNNSYLIAENTLAKYGKTNTEELIPYIMNFDGDSAISHLFKVAGGIDSMVIGEDEILGQTKNAYYFAKQCGTTSYEINMIFQSAIACAKKIKTQTMLSKTSVSTATLAANEAAKLGKDKTVLVIGATGKIGSTVLKNLVSHKNLNVIATSRHHGSDLNLTENTSNISIIDYDRRYEYMDSADCIISATSSPHYTVTAYDIKKNVKHNKNRLFIDLAVPSDIDKSIANIGGVRLIDIDYFEQLARKNNLEKAESVTSARNIITEEIDVLKKDLIFHDFLPCLENLKSYISDNSAETVLYKLKSSLSAEQFSAVIDVLKNCAGQV
ncbi:MAG: glutamyl-tRNA reductase [Clostridia bacterium]|nr:glutamyl-tRNA reductase [Clostridia bacterium]